MQTVAWCFVVACLSIVGLGACEDECKTDKDCAEITCPDGSKLVQCTDGTCPTATDCPAQASGW